MTSGAEYAELARAYLPQQLAERWISLLRPAIEFPYEEDADAPVALRMANR